MLGGRRKTRDDQLTKQCAHQHLIDQTDIIRSAVVAYFLSSSSSESAHFLRKSTDSPEFPLPAHFCA